MDQHPDFFVSTDWLAAHLGDPDVAIVDASWYLPAANRDPEAEYRKAHIPGAVRFELDEIADKATHLPHMLPSADEFAKAVGALGIGDGQTIVVYDGAGLGSSARVAWTFRVFGAKKVRILDGGFPKWLAEGRPVESATPKPRLRTFAAKLNESGVRDFAAMRRHVETGDVQILDARPADRFAGTAPEPRPGLKSGHMPGSMNLPSGELVANGRLRPAAEIAAAFAKAGVDLQKPLMTSCGSGVTAAVLALAAETIGAKPPALYDGSWSDWGGQKDAPVDTGPK